MKTCSPRSQTWTIQYRPIILLDDFPADFANCYKAAHEVAMVLFFIQRCVGLAHMERLNETERRRRSFGAVERLWRCTIRLRPLVKKCQATLLMVGANRVTTSLCSPDGLHECVALPPGSSASHGADWIYRRMTSLRRGERK